jgi:hypothetical protein
LSIKVRFYFFEKLNGDWKSSFKSYKTSGIFWKECGFGGLSIFGVFLINYFCFGTFFFGDDLGLTVGDLGLTGVFF